MLDLYAELRAILEAFDRAGIPYAIAGGLAISIYTTPRATEDIDVLVPGDGLAAAMEAVAPLGFTMVSRSLPVAGGRLSIQRLTKVQGGDVLPLDLVVAADPALTGLLARRERMSLEGRDVWVIGVDGLRTLKRLRGSAQDLADLEALGPDDR